ncbi:MAG: sulfatase-like hydrolase/transferase [Akkermansiaceae bacterium]|nr:sulfatase-like hydrolase/transferase [Akkermansiaceae bacterium]
MNILKIAPLLLFAPLSQLAQAEQSQKQPNIVFLMTDDQRWDSFGCYGRPEFRTENIDRLAKDGVVFDKAYHTVAICMPSRATIFSGRYLSNHRVGFTYPYNLTFPKSDFEETYPALLKKAGYRTGFVGKFGVPVTDEAYHVVDQVTGVDFKETLGSYFDYFAGMGVHFDGKFAMWPADEALTKIYDNKRPRNERTLKTGDAMIHFLETQEKGKPFCLSVSFFAVKNDSDQDMYPPHVKEFENVDFSVPENWVEGKNTKLPALLDNWRGVPLHLARTSTPELYQKLVRRFATQGYTVDQQVGRLVKKLEEMGELENTVIVYTSDNGRFHGSHGLYDKAIHYDESMKAPLVIYDGRLAKEKTGRRETALISMVDMAPTILSWAGIEPPARMQGKDFTGVINETQDMEQWRDAVYNESLFLSALHGARKDPKIAEVNERLIKENKSYRCRGVTNERYKYFVYNEHNPVIEELYDLEADPSEMNNLVDNPEYAALLEKLRNQTEKLHEDIIINRSEATTVMKLPAKPEKAVKKKVPSTTGKKHPAVKPFVMSGAAISVETASTEDGFKQLPLGKASSGKFSASQKTSNDPLASLIDGKLAETIGPVFGNGILDGSYKLDLGAVKPVKKITSWSHHFKGMRGAQKLTIYASAAETDPGWNLEKFKPLATIDTGASKDKFTAASLQAQEGKTLGDFRWIVWAVSPISKAGGGENTAFQEFAVETQ